MEPQNNRARKPILNVLNDAKCCDEHKQKSDAPNNNVFGQFRMKPYEARINACNGDCGSIIAKIIDCCAHSKVL